jgi:hypothetical protein
MTRQTILATALFGALPTVTPTAQAALNGPHDVVRIKGNEFAIMVVNGGASPTIKVFRAMGQSTWQLIGATRIHAGQQLSNGSLIQNIYFNGTKVRTVNGDLRQPFYRLFPSRGGDRVN